MGKGNMHIQVEHTHDHRVLRNLQSKCGAIVINMNFVHRFLNDASFCYREKCLTLSLIKGPKEKVSKKQQNIIKTSPVIKIAILGIILF